MMDVMLRRLAEVYRNRTAPSFTTDGQLPPRRTAISLFCREGSLITNSSQIGFTIIAPDAKAHTILRHSARNKKLYDGSVFIRRPANFSPSISLVNALSDQAQEATGFSAFRS